jgi:hypothetical protein
LEDFEDVEELGEVVEELVLDVSQGVVVLVVVVMVTTVTVVGVDVVELSGLEWVVGVVEEGGDVV